MIRGGLLCTRAFLMSLFSKGGRRLEELPAGDYVLTIEELDKDKPDLLTVTFKDSKEDK